MNELKAKKLSQLRRAYRVRAKVSGTGERPRLTVKRALSHIYAQVIDDVKGLTLAAASDKDVKDSKGKTKVEVATEVGKIVAERAKAKNISAVVFDRKDKRYHGRVKALADGAREGGLQF
ncbi:50S ribosomal protein L18 [Patescibacteria group bacterium]|nr:50S ribosomal protein L18 [Patescibacteria group bacterium]